MKKAVFAVTAFAFAAPLLAQKPVAAWDVVPYQRVDGVFNAGVVAFHDKPICVEFTINGKTFFKTSTLVENPRTGVKEYVVPFPAGKLSERLGDREFKLGAKVFAGGSAEPLVLPDLPIYSNGRGTLGSPVTVWADSRSGNEFADGTKDAPVKSLAQAVKKAGDGGTVYLKAGTYSLKMLGGGISRKYWTRITTAPGTERGDVKILAGRTGTEKLHFKNLNFCADVDAGDYGAIVMGESGKTMAWFENCVFTNVKGRYAGEAFPFGNKLIAYVTGGATVDMSTGPAAVLLRSHTIKSVASSAVPGNASLVVNCTVNGVEPGEDAFMNEFLSVRTAPSSWSENLIIYGLKAADVSCRAFTIQRLRNSAIVDAAVHGLTSGESDSVFDGEVENVYINNFSIAPQGVKCALPKKGHRGFAPKSVLVKNSSFGAIEGLPSADGSNGIEFRNCSYRAVEK